MRDTLSYENKGWIQELVKASLAQIVENVSLHCHDVSSLSSYHQLLLTL